MQAGDHRRRRDRLGLTGLPTAVRREIRGFFYRPDFPATDSELDNQVIRTRYNAKESEWNKNPLHRISSQVKGVTTP